MSAIDSDGVVVCHRIVVKPETLQEVDGLPLVTIQRSAILDVRLCHGLRTERPLIAIVGGILLVAVGLIGVRILVAAFLGTAVARFPKTGVLAALGLVFGPLLIYSALRRGPILRVETTTGTRTLQFGKKLSAAELAGFVTRARGTGLHITTDDAAINVLLT